MSSILARAALSVVQDLEVKRGLYRNATAVDKDAEWQRVNSYIADVLKDSTVLYAKLARLQGDFVGEELDRLMKVSEAVLTIGEELSAFSKAFYGGKFEMADSELAYGSESGSGGDGSDELFQPFGDTGIPPSASGEDLESSPEVLEVPEVSKPEKDKEEEEEKEKK
jgi:hypothetical protein